MEKALTINPLSLGNVYTPSVSHANSFTHSSLPPSSLQVVGRLKDMGFSEAAARKALEDSNWDETAAVNALLSS